MLPPKTLVTLVKIGMEKNTTIRQKMKNIQSKKLKFHISHGAQEEGINASASVRRKNQMQVLNDVLLGLMIASADVDLMDEAMLLVKGFARHIVLLEANNTTRSFSKSPDVHFRIRVAKLKVKLQCCVMHYCRHGVVKMLISSNLLPGY